MQAVTVTDFGESTVVDVPAPTPSADEVLVRVRRVQLSLTECWMWKGELAASDALVDRVTNGDGRVFGHEFCGEVVETGANIMAFEEGDRVYAPGKISCKECVYCKRGYNLLCENSVTIGFQGAPGALSEYFTVPEEPLRKLPDEVSDAEGAAMQPLADSLQTVYDADVTPGDVVAVIGAGVMGSQCGQVALTMGAERVYAVDVAPKILDLASELGMVPVDASERDPVEAIRAATDGVGPDIVFEAVGGRQAHSTDGSDPRAQAFQMVRPGGKIVPRGILTTDEITLNPKKMRLKAVSTIQPRSPKGIATTGPNSDLGQLAPQLVASNRVSIEQFTTHELSGLSAFAEAVEITIQKDEYDALGPAQLVLTE